MFSYDIEIILYGTICTFHSDGAIVNSAPWEIFRAFFVVC